MRYAKVFVLLLLLIGLMNCPTLNQAQQNSPGVNDNVVTGSLAELRNSRRVLLLVHRSTMIDSRGLAKTILDEAYRTGPETRFRYPRLYNSLARKLNNYMKKYQSISAAEDVSNADFIIFFTLLEYRRPLGVPYPYGEMFVILNNRANGKLPRIVWKSRKSSMWAEDALGDFLKDLRAVRGES
ncbi:MAG: hypothetical protein QOH25_4103 [Acidobacteriota bacterium]|jgi:hypothetical protein|nr:hypothetical protein [Acidobacteriota bacterium]